MELGKSNWLFRELMVIVCSVIAALTDSRVFADVWFGYILFFHFLSIPLFLLNDLVGWGIVKLLNRKKKD